MIQLVHIDDCDGVRFRIKTAEAGRQRVRLFAAKLGLQFAEYEVGIRTSDDRAAVGKTQRETPVVRIRREIDSPILRERLGTWTQPRDNLVVRNLLAQLEHEARAQPSP
jgi:hypothetical protein